MNIEVGDYVRDNSGLIGQLIRIERDDIDTSLKWYVIFDGKNERYINKPYITNYSKNIIDLIEKGDFVNEYRVLEIFKIQNNKYVFTICKSDFKDICRIWSEEDIKTILTKEQYMQNCYTVERS